MSANRRLGLMLLGVLGGLSVLPLATQLTGGPTIARAESADAQLGGLLRRARETITKPEPEQPAQQPATTPAQDPFADPHILPITEDQVTRFINALRYEIDKRDELVKLLSALKSPEEYQQCAQAAGTSQEMMQMIQDFADKSADLPADQMMKNMAAMHAAQGAMLAKRCGTNPGEWPESRRIARLQEIEGEAAAIAPPSGWTPPAEPEAAPASSSAVRAYAMLKERIPKYCMASREAPPASSQQGVRQIPGESAKIWYVYTEAEVGAMTRARCDVTINHWNLLTQPPALGS